jgi:Protein of unknown function (DUF4242)
MKKYLIERHIPGVGSLNSEQYRKAAEQSNKALAELGPENIVWDRSMVSQDHTFCIYYAKNEAVILKHAELSGFPANRITELSGVLTPAGIEPEPKSKKSVA